MKLLIASKNRGKVKEIKKALRNLKLQIYDLSEFSKAPSFREKGESFDQNAADKALFYNKRYDMLTVADDSGLMVDYLNGAPGVLSARFAGPQGDDRARIEKLLHLLRGVSIKKRWATFHCSIAIAEKGKIIKLIKEQAKGFILDERRGNSGFGYDPVFYYPPMQKTFAQLSILEKNKVSHRGKALVHLKQFLSQKSTKINN